jgi:HSP20 family protein
MDVPGIALADLDVSVENGKLTIKGERKAAERTSDYLHEERFFGQFERTVALNEWVDPSTIEATLSDGVLHLKLSKKPEAKRQKVSINYCDGSDAKRIETSK